MPLFRACIYCEDLFCYLIIIDGNAWFEYKNRDGNSDFIEQLFVTLIFHQFFDDLALTYFNLNEVMRLTAVFTEKKLKEEWADSVT